MWGYENDNNTSSMSRRALGVCHVKEGACGDMRMILFLWVTKELGASQAHEFGR